MTKEQKQIFTRRIANANRTGMITILYDIALTYIEDAISVADKDKTEFRRLIVCTKDVIAELINSVNTTVEPGRTIMAIYVFCNGELAKAYAAGSADKLEAVKRIFTSFRDTYVQCEAMDTSTSVMENTETVYTGLTYNRNSYQESISVSEPGRGFLV